MTPITAAKKRRKFDPQAFLSAIDRGRTIAVFPKRQTIFAQGDSSDAVFYIHRGRVKLTVVAKSGKEATIGILKDGDFFGEGCLAGQPLRMCSAITMTDCKVMRIDKKSMMKVIHGEHLFSDMFVAYLLTRNIRYEEDLVPARGGLLASFSCWLISARKKNPRWPFPRSVRKLWRKWWAQPAHELTFS
jgi:CRP/FNR family cyclic AMP-dependent transcriptional regulator